MQLTNLKTNFLGRNFEYYDSIDSTQDEILRKVASNEIKNGTLVIADLQTKGKGTHGRIWHTDETKNIAFSFYFETNCNTKKLEKITLEISEILVDIFKEKYKITLDIKVPNDLMINNKKVGGILTESKMISETVKYLVVGIGINTNKTNFTEDIKNIATSIKKEFEINVNNSEIISEFCNRFEELVKRRIEI